MFDELIKKIRHCATDPMHCLSCGEDKDGRCFKRLMTQAADAIEELSAIREEQKAQIILMAAEIEEQQPRWIPVTERAGFQHLRAGYTLFSTGCGRQQNDSP